MKVHLDCIPCSQRQALQAARFITDDILLHEGILRKTIDRLWWMKWTATPTEMAYTVHRIIWEVTGAQDPYRYIKKMYNDIALGLYPEMKKMVEKSNDPLLKAVRLAIADNIIAFKVISEFDIEETIIQVFERDFAINDFQKLLKSLERANTLTYLADNAGEIVFDRLLPETILGMYKIDEILFAVKGTPIINDATIEDAEDVGLNKLSGMGFVKIGVEVQGTGMKRNSKEFLNILDSMDVVIAKGHDNYGALSEHCGIFFLLMATCSVIAEELGVDIGDLVLKEGIS